MKLFDYLQDCVAIGAVLVFVQVMTADDDTAGSAVPSPLDGLVSQTLPSGDLLQDPSGRLRIGPNGEVTLSDGSRSAIDEVDATLSALERRLDGLLAGSGNADPARLAPELQAPELPAPDSFRSRDVVREVAPMPDAADYRFDAEQPLVPQSLPWSSSEKPSSAHRPGGLRTPSGSQPIGPVPTLESDDFNPFGTTAIGDAFDDVATRLSAPRRVR